jgi:flavin reductase (DIM6/NTAB) family NADH-FMN oxidoreductase RutF
MFFTPETRDREVLPFDPVKAIIAPRPIGWISTLSKDGLANLAPYSFFNLVGGRPPMLMFSSEGYKDTANNAIETGEFVYNYASRSLEEAMNASSIPAPAGISEFDHCGIERSESRLVAPPRVANALANLECKVTDVIEPKTVEGEKTGSVMVIGQVVGIHIDDQAIRAGRFDVTMSDPVTRLGYLDFGFSDGLHEMPRPEWTE